MLIPPFRKLCAVSHLLPVFLINDFVRFHFDEQQLFEKQTWKDKLLDLWQEEKKKAEAVEGGHWAGAEREVCNDFLQLHASSSSVFLSARRADTKHSGTGCRLSNVWSWEMGTPLFYFTSISKYIHLPSATVRACLSSDCEENCARCQRWKSVIVI